MMPPTLYLFCCVCVCVLAAVAQAQAASSGRMDADVLHLPDLFVPGGEPAINACRRASHLDTFAHMNACSWCQAPRAAA